MKFFRSTIFCITAAFLLSASLAQAAQDYSKIPLTCNTSVTTLVAEALRRDLILQIRNQLTVAIDKNTVAVSVRFSKKGTTPRQEFNTSEFKGGLNLSASIGATPAEGEAGEVGLAVSGSSLSSVPRHECSVVHKMIVTASFRRTEPETNRKIKFKGTLSSSNISVAGYFDKK